MTFQPSSRIRTRNPQESAKQIKSEPAKQIASEPAIKPEKTAEPSFPDRVDTLVIGLVALDTVSRLSGPTVRQDSNPGRSRSSIGGVGYNVSLAYKYGLESQRKNGSCRLVSAVGDDFAGRSILDQLRSNNIDTSGVSVVEAVETAQYSAILDVNGDLELACADMAIIEDATFTNHVVGQINRAQPRFVVVDCNLLPRGLDAVVDACSKLSNPAKVVVEPTSAPKLARIANVNSARLRVFPNNHIELVTPTADELDQMFQSFSQRDLFDDYDHWFPVVDSLGINSQFRDRMEVLAAKNLDMKYLLENGILQQSFQLLPYIPNILVKLGARGCVLVKLSGSVTDYRSVPTTSQFLPAFTMFSEGREIDEGKKLGVVVQHFPVPPANENLDIVDVTGAGDSLLGYLAASLANVDWLGCEIDSLEQEWGKWENIHKSQLASGKSLASHGAVSPEIANI